MDAEKSAKSSISQSKNTNRLKNRKNAKRLKKRKKAKRLKGAKKEKGFHAQIVCPCKRGCPTHIDVLRQKEIFDEYYGCGKWSTKTIFLRTPATKIDAKENLNPLKSLSKRKNIHKYFLTDESGAQIRVCLFFLSNVL